MKLYKIFDNANSNLLADFPKYYAKNSREALQKYLNNNGIKVKFIRSGDDRCRFGIIPIGGGKQVWFQQIREV